MSAETLALLALEKGVEVGAVGFKEARELFKEHWQKAFPDYDVEKVFFRCIYSVGLGLVAKFVYDRYVELKILGNIEAIDAALETTTLELLTAEPPKWMKWIPYFNWLVWLSSQIIKPQVEAAPETTKEQIEALKEEAREKLLKEIGIPKFVDDFMTKYFWFAVGGVCGWWIFSEYRSYKKLKALTTKIL